MVSGVCGGAKLAVYFLGLWEEASRVSSHYKWLRIKSQRNGKRNDQICKSRRKISCVWNVEVHLVPLARSVDSLADRQFAKYRIEEKKSPLLRFKSIQKRPFDLRWSVPILKQQEQHAHTSFPFPMPK